MPDSFLCRSCAVCGESKPNSFRIYFDGYIKLYKCRTCGFIAQYPGPGCNTVDTDYEETYSLSFLDKGQSFMYPNRRRALQDIADRIAGIKTDGRLLDVGCGDGHLLHLCRGKGYECYGVEPSRLLAEYAAKKTGAQIIQGMYEKDTFPQGMFDVITFVQVLEHIVDPDRIIDVARCHLKPSGLLVIEVPSTRAPHFLMYQFTKNKWFVKPPDGVIPCHVGYYTPSSLERLVNDHGFRTASLVTGRWQYKYGGVLGKVGKALDPAFDRLRIGGILLMSERT